MGGYMKKAEQYLKQLFEEPFNLEESSIEDDFLQVIKQAKIDAIEETCRVCAEEAELRYEEPCVLSYCECKDAYIDKQSILSVADKLKKELE
jgi:hypothetical protein